MHRVFRFANGPVLYCMAALAACLPVQPAFAQMNGGEITGRVTDGCGALLDQAIVAARNPASGQVVTAHTNAGGEYLLSQLPVGAYVLSISSPGFRQTEVHSFVVHAADHLRYDFTLVPGSVSETVSVEERSKEQQLESAEVRDVLGTRALTQLSLSNRQFLDLALFTPGVVRPPGGTRGDALQQTGNLINVLGQRSGHNLYLVDGATVTDEHFNNLVIAPSVDGITELNIEKTSYSPEFGGKSGAVINAVTRSGTNSLHGSLFEFARNSVFDAKNYFDSAATPIPPFQQNQFGGTAGGKLRQDRAFFFLSYEGRVAHKSLTQTFSVPTAAMRAGDFSGLATIYDPETIVNGQRQPFAGNHIGRALDPVASALVARIPLPNLPGLSQNLRAVSEQNVRGNQYTARVDSSLTSRDAAYLRFSLFDARQQDPFGSSVLQESLLPGFGRNLSTHALNGIAGWTHTFNTAFGNEARFGFLTVAGGQSNPNSGDPFAAQTGLQGTTQVTQDMGFPQVSFGGQFTPTGDPTLFTFRNNRDLELFDNAVWHHGRHTIKFGMYAMSYLLRPVNPNGARGVFNFTPRWTSSAPGQTDGNAFADFLIGAPTTAQAGLGRAAMQASTRWYHFYAQDSWQLTPTVKIDLGLRYELNREMTDRDNAIAAIDTTVPGGRFVIASNADGSLSPSANALLPLIPIAYTPSSRAGWHRSLLVARPLRLAPRGGIAYNLPDGKTVVRAGAGIYPNQAAYSIVTNLAQNLPFFVTKTVNTAVALQPTLTTRTALNSNANGTVGGNNLDHDFKIEYNEVWNANVDRELPGAVLISAGYIGSRTVHADSGTVLNVPTPGPGAIAARRPIPQLSQINDIRWNGIATYHALILQARRRFQNNLYFDANWTWSHSIDDASDPGATLNETNLPQNVYDLSSEVASSSFDHRHRVVVSAVYTLHFATHAAGMVRTLLNDLQLAGNFAAQSGAPFTVILGTDQANIGTGPAQRPDLVGDPNAGPKTAQQWLNTAAFTLPALYTFGNSARNNVIGPGLRQLDASLQKNFPLWESARLQLRAEAFNVLNHTNLNVPNRTAFSANFGRISSAQDARQMQLAAKVVF